MGLEDFEKELATKQERHKSSHKRRNHSRSRSRDRSHRNRHRHKSRHNESRHKDRHDVSSRRHKRRKASGSENDLESIGRSSRRGLAQDDGDESEEDSDEWVEKEADTAPPGEDTLDDMLEAAVDKDVRRDSWMQTRSGIEIDYVQPKKKESKSHFVTGTMNKDHEKKKHEDELKHQLKDVDVDDQEKQVEAEKDGASEEVSYTFGDSGSAWRMTKLRNVHTQAKSSNKPVEELAVEIYGDLKFFDDAREEEIELDRRKRYGEGYRHKEKPDGELHAKRLKDNPVAIQPAKMEYYSAIMGRDEGPVLDQTELNKLKAKMMKAKLRRASEADKLEAEYNAALASSSKKGPEVVTLNAMQNRMLASGRQNEVVAINNKRGQERGTVVENENMSIEDMVRQERRTRGRREGQALAERIQKDGKFVDDLDYMDDNADKLAKHVQRSDINLRNIAIEDYQKVKRALDTCPLCHNEEKGKTPTAPIISLGTRTYLTLATEPELSDGGAYIVPVEHHTNLVECDDDEWEEIRNFMKCLTRMYHAQGRAVLFYENATFRKQNKHAAMAVVPLAYELGETAPAFFREAILQADEEWSQHKKIFDTLAAARNGAGRRAFRNSVAKEMPYFHVWFELDGGMGHVVEDEGRWPKGDLFAREVIGGMLDVDGSVVKRQGRWSRNDSRIEPFRKRWRKFDWTRVLVDE